LLIVKSESEAFSAKSICRGEYVAIVAVIVITPAHASWSGFKKLPNRA
jgi:hypothetical protein